MPEKSPFFLAPIKRMFKNQGADEIAEKVPKTLALAIGQKIKYCAEVTMDVVTFDSRKKMLDRDAEFVIDNHIGGC